MLAFLLTFVHLLSKMGKEELKRRLRLSWPESVNKTVYLLAFNLFSYLFCFVFTLSFALTILFIVFLLILAYFIILVLFLIKLLLALLRIDLKAVFPFCRFKFLFRMILLVSKFILSSDPNYLIVMWLFILFNFGQCILSLRWILFSAN